MLHFRPLCVTTDPIGSPGAGRRRALPYKYQSCKAGGEEGVGISSIDTVRNLQDESCPRDQPGNTWPFLGEPGRCGTSTDNDGCRPTQIYATVKWTLWQIRLSLRASGSGVDTILDPKAQTNHYPRNSELRLRPVENDVSFDTRTVVI